MRILPTHIVPSDPTFQENRDRMRGLVADQAPRLLDAEGAPARREPVGVELLGRVLDGLGRPIDGKRWHSPGSSRSGVVVKSRASMFMSLPLPSTGCA